MSILDKLMPWIRDRDDVDDIPETVVAAEEKDGRTGGVVYSEDVVEYILRELERRRSERSVLELQWALNANFLAGHQNCDIDYRSNQIVTERRVERRDSERRVYNRIGPIMQTRHANLKSIDYDMLVLPRSSDLDDYAKAKVSTKLLQYCQSVTDFDAKKDKLIAWSELTGTAFTLSWWDPSAGEVVGTTEDGEEVRAGELAFGLVSSYEAFPASLTIQEIEDQPNIILEQVWDAGQVYNTYGLRLEGERVEHYVLTPVEQAVTGHGVRNAVTGLSKETREGAVRVITYLENPSRDFPRGRYITVVRDKIVYYGDLPAGILPLVAIKSNTVAGQFFGKSVIEDLIPLQRAYNRIVNKIHDFIDTIANNGWLVPSGSIQNMEEVEENGIESGATVIYEPQFGAPQIVEYPDPPSVVVAERDKIASDMEYTAGVSQLMVYGATPTGVTSGTAIENLRQIDSTRMSLTGDNIRDGIRAMARIWLRLNKRFSVGYRTLQLAGTDEIGCVTTWSAEDINSYDVDFEAENELRRSKEQQKQDFLQAFQLGLFTDDDGKISRAFKRRAWEMYQFGDMTDVMGMDELQQSYARRENTFLEHGIVPRRYRFDDDAIHVEEHKRYAISVDFMLLKRQMPEYAAKFEAHILEHEQAIAAKEAERMQQVMALSAAGSTAAGR